MLENRKFNGIHYSRYIASYQNKGGVVNYGEKNGFYRWMKSLGATDTMIREMVDIACMGKLELEIDCEKFINKN